jgi:hypothetical protein
VQWSEVSRPSQPTDHTTQRTLTFNASLASAMLYICTASLFVRLRMRLYESTGKDLEMAVDLSKHYPLRDSHGLRIEVPTSSVDIS